MSRVRRLLGPAVATVVMLAILLALGFWQVRRLAWKQDILAAIAHAEAAPPVPLPANPSRFEKVGLTGTFRPGLYVLYGDDVRDTPTGAVQGAQLIEPLFRPNAPPVLIDRGWILDGTNVAALTQPAPVTIAAYTREPERAAWFTPHADPAAHRLYTLDPAAIAAALHLPQVAPYTLIALGPPAGRLVPATTLPRPPNNHLQYLLTWFGLAFVLLVIFLSYARRILAEPEPAA